MPGRLLTAGLAAFWIVMNVLLWRAEFGGGRQTVDDVPLPAVLDRILTAADPSQLRLRHHDEEIGVLRWMPAVVEAAPATNDAAPEGMLGKLGGYHVDVDLNLTGEAPDRRWRVLGHVSLSTNQTWQEFHVRLIQRPVAFEIAARAGEDQVTVKFEDGRSTRFEQKFSEKELLQIPALFGAYLHLLPGNLDATRFQAGAATNSGPNAGPAWTARNDTLKIGPHRIRVYRVATRWLQRYEVVAYFSRAGELLRVSLPDHYSLVNDAVTPR
jgi:hypothetical protein